MVLLNVFSIPNPSQNAMNADSFSHLNPIEAYDPEGLQSAVSEYRFVPDFSLSMYVFGEGRGQLKALDDPNPASRTSHPEPRIPDY